MKKRMLSMAVALTMCVGLLPTGAWAAEGGEGAICTCSEQCTEEQFAEDCAVCAVDILQCEGKEAEPEEETIETPEEIPAEETSAEEPAEIEQEEEAEEEPELIWEDTVITESYIPDADDLPENDELFAGYVMRAFYGENDIDTLGDYGEKKLTKDELAVYRILKEKVEGVADGSVTSTQFTIDTSKMNITYNQGTGLSINSKTLLRTLLVDCPYELYWFDKVTGWVVGSTRQGTDVKSLTFSFAVAKAYATNQLTEVEFEGGVTKKYHFHADTTQTSAASSAVANAKKIIEKHKDKSDYEKLLAYKNEICELVSYNENAAKDDYAGGYGDPWQLIHVFDGDPNTNVVCEGYSKAFQYLCDLSTFKDKTFACYTVTGKMGGGTGAGDHMWNIVTLGNQNYLVDVTNSDAGTVGYNGKLFMAGTSNGNVNDGYTIDGVSFQYDDAETKSMYGADILKLAEENYTPPKETTLTITKQPTDLTLYYGYENAELTVAASSTSGSEITYQWYEHSLEGDTEIPDATKATFQVPVGMEAGTTKQYYCEVSCGEKKVDSNTVTVTVEKSGTEFEGGVRTYLKGQEGSKKTDFIYGDIVIVKVTPKATAKALKALFDAPASNQMAIFEGNTQLTEAKAVTVGQELTFEIKGLSAKEHTLTAKYMGNDNMADAEASVKITVEHLKTTDDVTLSGTEGENGWYTSEVTLTAPNGYTILVDGKEEGNSLTISAEGTSTVKYALKNADGQITKEKTVTVKIDKTKPVFEEGPSAEVNGTTVKITAAATDGGSGIAGYTLTGNGIEEQTSTDGNFTLNDLNPNTKYMFTVVAKDNAGNVSEAKTVAFATKETGIKVALSPDSLTYNGSVQKPTMTVTLGDKTLGKDEYTVSYKNNDGTVVKPQNAGTYTVVVTAVADNTNTATTTFMIGQKELTATIEGTTTTKTYDGNNKATGLSIKLDGVVANDVVTAKADSYTYDNANAGDAKTITANNITLSGVAAGNYKLSEESVTTTGEITRKDISGATITLKAAELKFNGAVQTAEIESITTVDGMTLTPADYEVAKNTGTDVGGYTLKITGTGNFIGNAPDTTWKIVKGDAPTVATQEKQHIRTAVAHGEVDLNAFLPENRGTTTYSIKDSSSYTGLENVRVSLDGKLTYDTKVMDRVTEDTITIQAEMQNYENATITVEVKLTDKAVQAAPAAFTLTFTLNENGETFTATIPAVENGLYSFDGKNYTESNTKTDCEPNTAYTGYVKFKETDTCEESAATSDTQTTPKLTVQAPVITPNGGNFAESQEVDITCGTKDAKIYYTTDGSAPTTSSNEYTGKFTVTASTVIRAIAVRDKWENSAEATAIFVKNDDAGVQTQIKQDNLETVPEGLKATEFNTLEKIEKELLSKVVTESGYTADKVATYDVKLQIKINESVGWIDATEANYPKEGIEITIPYPEGTSKKTHDFVVTHMFTITSADLGTVAGQVEKPSVTKLDNGIAVTLKGLSPVSVAWKELKTGGGSSSGGSGGSGSKTNYAVSVDNTKHGEISLNHTKATKGTVVTITVKPDEGYELGKLTVTNSKGDVLKLTDKGNGKFTFTMPASKITVDADFVKKTETPAVPEEVKPIILTINQKNANVFGEMVVNDVAPMIRNDRTMLPARFVAQALGGVVEWNAELNKVTITKGDLKIEIFIGSPFALVNGNPIELDSPAFIENSRTYLPVRFIAENLGATVAWNPLTQEVTITPNK